MVEQVRDKSQPKDSDTVKMLEYTEARFAQYRKDANRKLVLHQKRIFELEDELRKLKGETSSDEDEEDVKPTRVVQHLCTGVFFFTQERSIPVKMSQGEASMSKERMKKFQEPMAEPKLYP